jgi:hypothetical protein
MVMKKVIRLTEEDISRIVTEAIDELSNVARLRRNMNGDSNGFTDLFASSPDKYVPNNPRHQKGYDTLRDWVNYVCQKCGYDSDDVSKILTRNPMRNFHNQETVKPLMDSYRSVFNYCINTLKLRPGVINDIARSVGEDLSYGMLN